MQASSEAAGRLSRWMVLLCRALQEPGKLFQSANVALATETKADENPQSLSQPRGSSSRATANTSQPESTAQACANVGAWNRCLLGSRAQSIIASVHYHPPL